MNIFHKRPLGLILCVILSGFTVFALSSFPVKIVLSSLGVLFFAVALIIKKLRKIKLVIICSVLLCLSFALSFLYFDLLFYPSGNVIGIQDSVIIGEVIDINQNSEYSHVIDLKVESVNEIKCNSKIKVYIYGASDEISSGDVLRFTGTLSEFDSDSDFDFRTYYTAKGFSGQSSAAEYEILTSRGTSVTARLKEIRLKIAETAVKYSNNETGSMLAALLLGEREMLGGQVRFDFQSIGITHILSLSGMHLAMLTGGLDRILYLCKVGKKWRLLIGCAFCMLFMALTGFPLSVCRAGIMLIISSVIYLITGSKDSITSLLIATALIIIVSPYSAMDIGLWLSVIATAGILIGAEMINEEPDYTTGVQRLKKSVKISFIFSFFSIASTCVISLLTFDTVSSISIISTFLSSVLVEIFVYVGILVLLVGSFIPIGGILIFLNNVLCSFSALLSDIPFIYSSSSFVTVRIMATFVTLLFLLFAILKIERKKTFVSVICVLYAVTLLLSVTFTEICKTEERFTVYSEDSDRILIKNSGKSALISLSSHKKSDGYTSRNILLDEHIVDLDEYIIVNYSKHLSDEVETVLSSVRVGLVRIPMPEDQEDESILLDTVRVLNNYRVKVSFYNDEEYIHFGDFGMYVPFRSNNENSFALCFNYNDEIISYLSKGALENCKYSEELLYVSDTIIFGNYGKSYESDYIVYDLGDHVSDIIIFDDKIKFDFEYYEFEVPNLTFDRSKVNIK